MVESQPLVAPAVVVTADWRRALPVLTGIGVTLRELHLSDAQSLLSMLSVEEVTRFISPPPTTVEGFERFVLWTQRERAAGTSVCFGVVPDGHDRAIGIVQIRRIDPDSGVAEWGFALGMPHWGSGVFVEGSRLVIDFAVDALGVDRLEARAAVANGRGNGALKKIGAVCEGVLKRSYLRDGEYLDQNLWSIGSADWRRLRLPPGASIH